MRKGQLTIFMLLGILILGSFLFAFYVQSKLAMVKLKQGQKEVLDPGYDLGPLQVHVTSCLDSVSLEALKISGEQGGPIYGTQVEGGRYWLYLKDGLYDLYDFTKGGLVPFHTTGSHGENIVFNVTYGIRMRRLISNESGFNLTPYPPQQPYLGKLQSDHGYALADPEWPISLCKSYGPNAKDLELVLNKSEDWLNNTCLDVYKNETLSNDSIQAYLEMYIAEKMRDCVDFETFGQQLGLAFESGSPNATVVFGDEDVFIVLFWPLKISKRGEQPFTKTYYFVSRQPIRYKTVFFTFLRLLEQEKRNPFFDIDLHEDHDACKLQTWLGDGYNSDATVCTPPNITVDRFADVCKKPPVDCALPTQDSPLFTPEHWQYTDVIRLTDLGSLVGGSPFIFQFAAENRRPALDWVNQSYNPRYDIITMEGEELVIDPYAYDPDFDFHDATLGVPTREKLNISGTNASNGRFYVYHNWWEDEVHTFLFYKCRTHLNPTAPCDCTTDYTCAISNCNLFGTNTTCFEWPITSPDPHPHKLTGENMSGERGTARFKVSKNDTGLHYINLSVCDNEGLCDWQNISVLVLDQPVAEISPVKIFPDIPENVVSVEDPFVLNGSNSIVFIGGPMSGYRWADETSGLLVLEPLDPDLIYDRNVESPYFGELPAFTYPQAMPSRSYSIYDITATVMGTDVYHKFPSTGNKKINLTVAAPRDREASTSLEFLDVNSCLPAGMYVGSNYPNPDPFPYNPGFDGTETPRINPYGPDHPNNAFWTPFYTRHVCCRTDTMTPYTDTRTCYSQNYYTILPYPINDPRLPDANHDLVSPANILVLDDAFGNLIPPSRPYTQVTHSGISWTTTAFQNDIFIRNFDQQCSGQRGNACSGPFSDEWTRISCDDQNPGESRRCEAPCLAGEAGCDINSPWDSRLQAPYTCKNVPQDTTFEEMFDLASGSSANVCNTNWKCGRRDGLMYPSISGKQTCQGTCDGSGSCARTINCICQKNSCEATCSTNNDCGTQEDRCIRPGPRQVGEWLDRDGEGDWDWGGTYCDNGAMGDCQCKNDPQSENRDIDENNDGSIKACEEKCSSNGYDAGVHAGNHAVHFPTTETNYWMYYNPSCCGDDLYEYYSEDQGHYICCDRSTDCGVWDTSVNPPAPRCIQQGNPLPGGGIC
ncbi:MAG: hypothetical protein V1735_04965 [Nanoarchaeota archaeon]